MICFLSCKYRRHNMTDRPKKKKNVILKNDIIDHQDLCLSWTILVIKGTILLLKKWLLSSGFCTLSQYIESITQIVSKTCSRPTLEPKEQILWKSFYQGDLPNFAKQTKMINFQNWCRMPNQTNVVWPYKIGEMGANIGKSRSRFDICWLGICTIYSMYV